jgi:hypothetical protein
LLYQRILGLLKIEGNFPDRAGELGNDIADALRYEHIIFDDEKFITREWARFMRMHDRFPSTRSHLVCTL